MSGLIDAVKGVTVSDNEKKVGPLNVLMVGTGEYTTGFVGGAASGSDKKVGVVGLTLFDLRRRGKVGKLSMVGTSGNKFPAIRKFFLIRKHGFCSPATQERRERDHKLVYYGHPNILLL